MNTVFVGAGGLFWAGLPQSITWMYRRGCQQVVIFDPDKLQERNYTRQWGSGMKGYKAIVAAALIRELTKTPCLPIPENLNFAVLDPSAKDRFKGDVYVFCFPDNHLCRLNTHIACSDLAEQLGNPVRCITAGNSLTTGMAFSCIHNPDGTVTGDWMPRNQYIVKEAVLEEYLLAHPTPCGSLDTEGGVEQSFESNDLTAFCIWSLAEDLSIRNVTGCKSWFKDNATIQITEKFYDNRTDRAARDGIIQKAKDSIDIPAVH